jgi:MFS family permease
VLPAQKPAGAKAPLDLTGILVVFVLLAALVFGITRVVDPFAGMTLWPWFLVAVVAMLPVLVAVEKRAAAPMIPLSLFANRQLAIAYLLTAGAGFGMGGVIFLTSIATLAYAVAPKHAGFVLMPLVICSMVGSMGAGRLLNRMGARAVVVAGFAMLALGYAGSAITTFGLWGFLLASMPVGLGVGIVVGGALRSIAIDEAPVAVRGSAQGLINICTSIGTLLSAAAIGALADFSGGGAAGFGVAYMAVGALMLLMLFITLALRSDGAAHRTVEAAP